tara:strand:- start:8350 stop:8658 length:309 start_codon:yes stop_codon:yes gene_type:complete
MEKLQPMISTSDLGKLAAIRWIDAKEIGVGWHSQDEVNTNGCVWIISVGWITGLTALEVKISADIAVDPKDDEVGRSQAIPMKCVFSVDFIGEKKDYNVHIY